MTLLKENACYLIERMNKFFHILIVGFLLVNCTSNTILKKPENLIPKDQMVDILTDLFIAIHAETTKNIDLHRKVNYYPLIYAKYGIDSAQFKESNYYYTSKIDKYEAIFSEIEVRLNRLKEELQAEKRIEDSIARFDREIDRKVLERKK
jgi:hypothetical protein